MKRVLERLFRATLRELAPGPRVRAALENLPAARRRLLVAFGKAALPMARAACDVGDFEGIVVAPEGADLPGLVCMRGGHPLPNEESHAAAVAVLDALDGLGADDLALFLISGGGSALVEMPLAAGTDLRAVHERLVTCGAGIVEANVVRKHLSAVKGGRLALRAAPARQITLLVSDVPAAHPDAVASGPTMPDPSTVGECRAIAARWGVALPAEIPETPKPGDSAFDRSEWRCLLDNDEAVRLLAGRAARQGWVVEIDLSVDDLPVREALDRLLARLEALRAAHPGATVAVVSGGELSCPVTGPGVGGRNQHFALLAAQRLAGRAIAVLSAGTDGIDGNSQAAGAVADAETVARARAVGLDVAAHERGSDSGGFFAALGDTVRTGPTGTNVRDLRILVAK